MYLRSNVEEQPLALSGNDLSVFNHKEPLVELTDAGGGPSISPRVSKGFVAVTQARPFLTVPPQRRCAVGDPGVGLLPGSAAAEKLD